jgi:hypothetical protein
MLTKYFNKANIQWKTVRKERKEQNVKEKRINQSFSTIMFYLKY